MANCKYEEGIVLINNMKILNPIPMRIVDGYYDMLAQIDIIPLGTLVIYQTEYYNWQWVRDDSKLGYMIISRVLRDDIQETIYRLEVERDNIDTQIKHLKELQKSKKREIKMLNKLKQMLDKVGIESKVIAYRLRLKDYAGFIYYNQGHQDKDSDSWSKSYGYGEGKLEIQISSLNLNTEFELLTDSINHNDWLAVLTPEEAFKRIKYCIDNKTNTYVEEEKIDYEKVGNKIYFVFNNKIEEYEVKLFYHRGADWETEYVALCYIKDDEEAYFDEVSIGSSFISHSKRKCLEYIYLKRQKEINNLIEKQTKTLEEMKKC